jgi:hypothetical protein
VQRLVAFRTLLSLKVAVNMKHSTESNLSSIEDQKVAANSFAAYADYNRTLRTWLVAFGIGGPALFMTNNDIAKRLAATSGLRDVVALFLFGTGAQILGALINKAANWYVYQAYCAGGVRGTWKHRCSEWLTPHFWIDVALDLLTILVFGRALWLLFTAFA